MYTQLNQYHVVMEVEPQFWQDPETLRYIYVAGGTGGRSPCPPSPTMPPPPPPSWSTIPDSFPR